MDTFNAEGGLGPWAKNLQAGFLSNDQTIGTPYFMTPKTSMNPSSLD
jgi:hypothetical protein